MESGEPVESTESVGGKRSAWMAHVKKTMKANKGKSLKAVLKLAGKTYKKTKKTKKGGALSPLPLSGGRRKTAKKGGRKH